MRTRKKFSGEPLFLNNPQEPSELLTEGSLDRRINIAERRDKGRKIGLRKKTRKSDTFRRNTNFVKRISNRLKKKKQRLICRDGNKPSLERNHLDKAYRTNEKGRFGQKMSLVY